VRLQKTVSVYDTMFRVFRAVKIRSVFCVVILCAVTCVTDVSEEYIASIYRVNKDGYRMSIRNTGVHVPDYTALLHSLTSAGDVVK